MSTGNYEHSWHKSLFHGQNIMPGIVRDQGDRPSCFLQVLCEGNEIEFRRELALEDPSMSTDLLFDVDSFIADYEKEVGCALGDDPPGRLPTAIRLFKEQGVYAHSKVWEEPRRLSMFQAEEHPDISFEGAEDLLSQGRPIIGGFTIGIDDNFDNLGRDDIYSFDPSIPHAGTYDHLVVFVGSGMRDYRCYLVFLNTDGVKFGEDGFGRVWFDQVRAFHTVNLWAEKTPPPSPALADPSSSSTSGSSNTGGTESLHNNVIYSSLDSRQLGGDTTKCLSSSSVLVSGLQGLGAEITKNLVVAGVKFLTLHDDCDVDLWDLSSNFFLSEKDVGRNRAHACMEKLQDLTNDVSISTLTGGLTVEHLSNFQVVVFTDICLEKAVEFDYYCHSHQPPIAFIKSEVRGLFGCLFCDFGPDFTVLDDGKEPHTRTVASISNDNRPLVSCIGDDHLEFQDGDLVVFSGVDGMFELNDGKPRKVKNAMAHSFIIEEDTSSFGTYSRGGVVTQVKPPKVIKFKPLKEAMAEPGKFLTKDLSNFECAPLLHLAFQALDMFRNELRRFPVPGSKDDMQMMINFVAHINNIQGDNKLKDIDRELLHHFTIGSRAVLNPMAATFGSIVSQEIVKACSGRFHPVYQFFYFHFLESLPFEPLEPGDLKPANTRYDAQISVFGSKLQNKLEQAKIFMFGSGALGCEILKNMALMGVACSQNGKLTMMDDNVIEKINLSRQFLFRDWNIGQPRSTVAATAASKINPDLHVEALQNRASPETENVFDGPNWENLDVIVCAHDNVTARMCIDSRCVYFRKPLLESGTLGSTCNTHMVIPHLTENHGASGDVPQKLAPIFTVHSFPNNIAHCLTWALSEFEELLESTPTEVNAFLSNPLKYATAAKTAGDANAIDQLERVIECLDGDKCEKFQDCITWSRLKFEDYFSNRVKQLTNIFPEDSVTSSGAPFWSAPKRFPRPVEFSLTDEDQLNFILAASILRAEVYGIPIPDWAKTTNKLGTEAVSMVTIPPFEPHQGVKIVADEKAISISYASVSNAAIIEELTAKLEEIVKILPPGFYMKPIQFDMHDDNNFHMNVIAGFANMRARSHGIREVDKRTAKFIAGRKIPGIVTSTAMAAGLICLKLYKVLAA